jgi:hypothetical protein
MMALSDACSDFNCKIADFVSGSIKDLKENLDNYDDPFWGYVRGEIPAVRRAIAAFENESCAANYFAPRAEHQAEAAGHRS